jgi:hypothetical protein
MLRTKLMRGSAYIVSPRNESLSVTLLSIPKMAPGTESIMYASKLSVLKLFRDKFASNFRIFSRDA